MKNSDSSISTNFSENLSNTVSEIELSFNPVGIKDKNIYSSSNTDLDPIRNLKINTKTNNQKKEKNILTSKEIIRNGNVSIFTNDNNLRNSENEKILIPAINIINDEIASRKIIYVSENSTSFDINFNKWCEKIFNQNIENLQNNSFGKEKEKEKEILKNGNIDELFEYINSNNNKFSEKKQIKKKKKNKNKFSKEPEKANIINSLNKIISENNLCNSFANNINLNDNSIMDNSKIYDVEVEIFKKNIELGNKKASEVIKIKPIFSVNWLEKIN